MMKKSFRSKNWLIVFVIAFAFFASSAGFFIFNFNQDPDIVRAGIDDNVFGFAWNSNIGWISFNSADCDVDNNGFIDTDAMVQGCGGDNATAIASDYGVNIDPVTGNFSGYAWSNNIGWVRFQQSAVPEAPPDSFAFSANCDDPATCDDIGDNCTACYNFIDNKIYGWAKILSLGDGGWIKLRNPASVIETLTFPATFPITFPITLGNFSGSIPFPISFPVSLPIEFSVPDLAFGTSIDAVTLDFSGWAWNGDDIGAGIGWTIFNSADIDCDTNNNGFLDTGCGGDDASDLVVDYKVYVSSFMPGKPAITSITPLTNFQCERLVVSWGGVSGEEGYRVFRDAVQVSPNFNNTVFSFTDTGLDKGTDYNYVVQAFNSFGVIDSDVVIGTTYSICAVSGITGIGKCPNIVELDWDDEANADHYEVQRCNNTNLDCLDLGNYNNPFSAGDNCYEQASSECIDNIIPNPAEIHDDFQYRVRAIRLVPAEIGDWSDTSDPIQPCPPLPTWKEVK